MNAERLINMVLRMFVRKAVNTGMRKLGGAQGARQNGPQDASLKQARRAAKMARRMGRM